MSPAAMACEAKWAACWLEPHMRFRLTAGTVTGKPASNTPSLPMLAPCSPAWVTVPFMTSSTFSASSPERSSSPSRVRAEARRGAPRGKPRRPCQTGCARRPVLRAPSSPSCLLFSTRRGLLLRCGRGLVLFHVLHRGQREVSPRGPLLPLPGGPGSEDPPQVSPFIALDPELFPQPIPEVLLQRGQGHVTLPRPVQPVAGNAAERQMVRFRQQYLPHRGPPSL